MFSSLIGNRPVADSLRRFVLNSRVPHAVVFAGPEGVGKKQFALQLAKAFVCIAGGHEACLDCAACRRIRNFSLPGVGARGEDYDTVFFGEHPDVGLVIPFNRNLRVGSIRKLEVEANYRPFEARARVFIVDDADKMNDAASNALLKTLEEPPSSTYIVLVTSRPDSLLQTIRSRCQFVRFAPVEASTIETHLRSVGSWTPEDASIASRGCLGSVAKALSFNVEKYREARAAMIEVLESLMDRRVSQLLQLSERLNDAKNKDDFEENLLILETLIRDTWLLRNGVQRSAVANCDIADRLASLSEHVLPSVFSGWLMEIETLRENFAVNINRKVATDALFVSMAG